MTMEPSPRFAKEQLQVANETLSDAAYLLHGGRLKAAANRAYYAMFYAASAALTSVGVKQPKRHRGVISLFHSHFVRTGRIPQGFHRDLVSVFHLRQQTDYDLSIPVGEGEVREAVERAAAFVAEVTRITGA